MKKFAIQLLVDCVGLFGCGLALYGCGLVYEPLSYIIGGAALISYAVIASKRLANDI